ncbi:unnamed protein product [Ascophyllum nodosum]
MVNAYNGKCRTEGCGKQPSYGVAGTKPTEYCAQHAPDGMVNVYNRKCKTEGCGKQRSHGVAGTKTVEYCAQHAPDGMVNVCSKKCRTEGCGKQPSYGVAGTKTAKYCAPHAPNGMVNVCKKMGRTESCKRASFGMASTNKAKNFAQHAPNGMVDACSRKCRTEDCGKKPSFGRAKTRMAEYCAQHARLKCGVKGYRDREVDHHHSGKETIGNILPSGTKHQAVHSPATTSPPSEGSQGSRKRVRHPEITSTALMRPISRESAGGARTMPDIDGQRSPVKRDACVKVEVLLSL